VSDSGETVGDRGIEQVAERLFWWQTPQQALRDSHRFAAQVMALGTDRDVAAVERCLGAGIFDAVLDSPPAGVFAVRRWNYWHVRQRRSPVPALPIRSLR